MGVTICALFCSYIGGNFNMDKKKILIFINLVNYILAQKCEPDYYDNNQFPDGCDCEYIDDTGEYEGVDCPDNLKQQESAEPCSNFFKDSDYIKKLAKKFDFDNITIEQDLEYECVEECNDNRDKGVSPYSPGPSVAQLINIAQNAKCPGGITCCNKKWADKPKPGLKCQEPYKCVLSDLCSGDVTKDPKMNRTCEEERSGSHICCNKDETKARGTSCSDKLLYENDKQVYSCISRNRCLKNNIDKRTFNIGPASLAEEATCSSDSEVCCHELDIIPPCSDYANDGYKCSKECFESELDIPP